MKFLVFMAGSLEYNYRKIDSQSIPARLVDFQWSSRLLPTELGVAIKSTRLCSVGTVRNAGILACGPPFPLSSIKVV